MKKEIDVDSFTGGEGACTGIEQAKGKPVDSAVNHGEHALAMHEANHPDTVHFRNDICRVDPAEVAWAGPVRIAWLSPDCTHFSKAKECAPVRRKTVDQRP